MKRYEAGLFRQLTETIEENDRLKVRAKDLQNENTALKSEVRHLRDKIARIESSLEERIQCAVNMAVEKALIPLQSEIEIKNKEIKRLKAIINKDSSNSSKPPSTDGFKKIPNNREKSEKNRGGQRGHKGKTLTIPKNLDELVETGKAEHKIVDLTDGADTYVTKWEIDVKTIAVYTEYRCPTTEMPGISYGTNLKAYATVLLNDGFMSLERVSDFLSEITYGQVTVSVATLEKFNREVASRIDIEALKNDLLNGEVLHIDETPLKSTERKEDGEFKTSEKTTLDVIVRTHSNATTTLYTVNPHKDDKGVEKDGIIPLFCGIFSHDHDKKYYKYGSSELHASCNAHLSRDLKGLSELYNISWATDFRKFINEMNAYKEVTTVCPAGQLSESEHLYDDLLMEGNKILESNTKLFGYNELRRMVNRLTDYKQNYMLFIRNYKAPFTNNQAERDLRPCKTKQKISGCFRSWNGVVCYAKIRSLISTTKKRGQNLLTTISDILTDVTDVNPFPAE